MRSTLDALSNGTQTLEGAYEDAVKRLQSQLPEDVALATRILSWIVYAGRAITTTELRHALAIRVGDTYLDQDNLLDIEDVVSVCAGLVTIDNESDVVRLVHYTTQQYFERIRHDWSPHGQLDIARTCLTYLAFEGLKNDVCRTYGEFESRLRTYPFLSYAGRYWGVHTATVQEEVSDLACSILFDDNLVSCIEQVESYVEYGGRTYIQLDSKGQTGLHVIAALGLRELAEVMITRLAMDAASWILKKDDDYRNCLYVAAEHGRESMVKLLLHHGTDPNVSSGRLGYAICAAVAASHEGIVRLLLEHGADVNPLSKSYSSPLKLAFRGGNVQMFKLLLDQGADATLVNAWDQAPLQLAAEEGWDELMGLLVDANPTVDLDATDGRGWTPLYGACYNDHPKVVELLLSRGATVDLNNKQDWYPTQTTANSGYTGIMKILLDYGADPNRLSNTNNSLLHIAAVHGHVKVVELLIGAGSHINVFNTQGRSPLDFASLEGHAEVVQFLTDRGANVNTRDIHGFTPIHIASDMGHLEIVNLLLQKGADPHTPNAVGCSPLLSACASGHLDVVKTLLDHGADIYKSVDYGWLPITIATSVGYVHIVELLLPAYSKLDHVQSPHGNLPFLFARGGSTHLLRLANEQDERCLHTTNEHGRSPLHTAVRHGHLDAFRFLTSIGLDPLTPDSIGYNLLHFAASSGSVAICNAVLDIVPTPTPQPNQWTPLHWACRAGDPKVIERLVSAGLQRTAVTLADTEDPWSPADITAYCGHAAILSDLSDECRNALGPDMWSEKRIGKAFHNVKCDGCDHVSSMLYVGILLSC